MKSAVQTLRYCRQALRHYRLRKTLRFMLKVVLRYRLYGDWFFFVNHGLPEGLTNHEREWLVPQPSRSYMRGWLTSVQKVQMLQTHYGQFLPRIPPSRLTEICQEDGVAFSQQVGKSGRHYELRLHSHTYKEGDVWFLLWDTELDAVLATLRGTFGLDDAGQPVFWIGALQGPIPPVGRDDVAFATKDLNVLRPKQAVFMAAVALCEQWGVQQIYAPPLSNHIGSRFWHKVRKRNRVVADYDGFFEEYASSRTKRGDYVITLPLPRRKAEDVPSKRRKEWMQRYARIDQIGEDLRSFLSR